MSTPIHRRTIARPAHVAGTGLFTDIPASAALMPAEPGTGIVFVVMGQTIPATVSHVATQSPIPAFAGRSARHTVLTDGNEHAITVEHVMACVAGLGITDLRIELGPSGELPIGDGSSAPYEQAIAEAGLEELEETIEPMVITKRIELDAGDGRTITAEPADSVRYTYIFEPDPPLVPQRAEWDGSADMFIHDIASARTFSFRHEAELLRRLGLCSSFSPADLLVIDAQGRPIDNAWRFDNEPARHKLLDLIGDLALVGRPIIGRITATRTGHSANHRFAAMLASLG
ncbi:MAG TPA: hypothetical protein ENJ00_05060 [Phycisphaerales bacterium]|nr:hypothetical protein [Phycisphaerales bacterium]